MDTGENPESRPAPKVPPDKPFKGSSISSDSQDLHRASPTVAPARTLPAVLAAQFLSALADNALLFVAIALVRAQQRPADWVPLLQEFFVLAFVILAPFAGPFADAFSKGRVMLAANGLKLIGALALTFGLHPLLAYGLVGVGAALYSPAKYGILSEFLPASSLVRANSAMEGSTIVAILLGVSAGGWLADRSTELGLWTVSGCYFVAMLANLAIPRLPAAHPGEGFAPGALMKGFVGSTLTAVRNPDMRFSLACTSLFWGTGATLRLLLVAWVPFALGVSDTSTAANLNGAVAVGIAVGAGLASVLIGLDTANRALIPGFLLGPLILLMMQIETLVPAIAVLIAVGVCGGLFVVPLNALLQERGHQSVGAGHAVAIQNLFENAAMLAMIGLYAASVRAEIEPVAAGRMFAGLILIGLVPVALIRFLGQRRRAAAGR